MGLIVVENSIPANSTNPNVLSGSAFEFTGGPSRVDVGVVGAATGLLSRIQFGSEIEVESMAVPVWSAANRGPIVPDEIFVRSVARGGDRLVVAITNTTAGALVARTLVQITPL